jgi:peptidoglycan/xylan/chitin deacetylase (PgdA/CDA1 family)
VTTTFKEPSEYGKVIALTFDDGPSVYTMNVMLDTFEKYDAKASFFLVGNNISEGTTDVVKRAFDMGCEIESHSQTHSYMNQMTEEEIKAEMSYTDGLIEEITGVTPKYFRPPYIAVNETMYESIDKIFISGVGCDDWDESVDSATISQRVLDGAQDGEIVLLHDNERTAEALETIIPALLEDGYELVTVSELFHAKEAQPQEGVIYSNALD